MSLRLFLNEFRNFESHFTSQISSFILLSLRSDLFQSERIQIQKENSEKKNRKSLHNIITMLVFACINRCKHFSFFMSHTIYCSRLFVSFYRENVDYSLKNRSFFLLKNQIRL